MLGVNSSYKICGIYSIYNKETGFSYVGSSRTIYERLSQHIWKLRANRHTNEYLQNSFNKHGEEAFEIIILEICTENNLKIREEFYILNTAKRYNIVDKPTGPLHLPTPTEERRRKVSKANKGRKITEEQRKRFSESHKGLKQSEENKKKKSEALKVYYSDPENRKLQSEKTINSRDKSRETFLTNHPDGRRLEWTINICPQCKNEFERQPHLAKRTQFCSNKCRNTSMIGRELTQEHKDSLREANNAFLATEKGKIHLEKLLKAAKENALRSRIPFETRICACGCNETFKVKLTSKKHYIKGHFHIKKQSSESIQKRKEAYKKWLETPKGKIYREKMKIVGLQARLKQLSLKQKVTSNAN